MTITLDLNTDSAGVDDTSSYTENGPDLTLFGHASVSSGADSIDSITLSIANYNGSETLSVTNLPGTLFADWDAAQGTLTISPMDLAVASDSAWQTALNSIVYNDTSNDAPAATRTITVTASNNVNSFPTATETITVTRVNDFPTVNIVPTECNATEQTTLNLKGTGLTVDDLDSGSANVTLELKVTEGVITANATGIAGINVISGSNTNDVNIVGTLTAIKALLAASGTNTLSYIDNSDTPAADVTLTVTLRDNGNTGTNPVGGSIPGEDTARSTSLR